MSELWDKTLSADHEPHKVMIVRDVLVDSARGNRAVPIKVYYPAVQHLKNLPIIFWSHGFGGSVDGAAFLSRYISAHEYVIVHVQHEGTDSSLWEGIDGHPWDILRATKISRETTLHRMKDIPFILDCLPQWLEKHPEIESLCDLKNLGISGHSFGALTTQVLAGMVFPDITGQLCDMGDYRFRAALPYSPGPIDHLAPNNPDEIYTAIKIPVFYMTGTDDASPIDHWGYEKRLVVYDYTKTEKYLLVLNDGDHMVFAGSRGKLGHNANRHIHEAIIKTTSLAFWQAQLKNCPQAREWLTGEGIRAYLAGNALYKWEPENKRAGL